MTLLAAYRTSAQEFDNVSNKYGPPNYTGGTVMTPAENYALYNQANVDARAKQINTAAISNVYPNPSFNFTQVFLDEVTTEPVTVSIVNLNGVLVQSIEYPAGASKFYVDVSGIPVGHYALQVQERGKLPQAIQLQKAE